MNAAICFAYFAFSALVAVQGQSVPTGATLSQVAPVATNAFQTLPITAAFPSSVNESAYVANLAALPSMTVPSAATLTPLGPDQFQPMSGNGFSILRITLQPCALLETHVHPRGTELLISLDGNLTVGHADEAMRSFTSVVQTWQYTIFPKGMVHFYLNSNCSPVTFDLILNDENAGTNFMKAAYADFDNTTQATLGVSGIEPFTAPAKAGADAACTATCGLGTSTSG